MWFFKVDGDQISYVATYFNIRIWAAPATLALYVLFGWLFGMQNAVYPLILTIVINRHQHCLKHCFHTILWVWRSKE